MCVCVRVNIGEEFIQPHWRIQFQYSICGQRQKQQQQQQNIIQLLIYSKHTHTYIHSPSNMYSDDFVRLGSSVARGSEIQIVLHNRWIKKQPTTTTTLRTMRDSEEGERERGKIDINQNECLLLFSKWHYK